MEMRNNSHAKLSGWKTRLCLWVSLAALAALPLAARAHAQLQRSNPANNATLAHSPKQIELWFSELLEDGFNSVEVFPAGQLQAAQRTNLAEGAARLDSKDRTHMFLNLNPLPPGEYVVQWRVLSRDGHTAPGRIQFRVAPAR